MKVPIDVIYQWCGLPESTYCAASRELEFSVKSVKKFMPWTRYIFVCVSDDFNDPNFFASIDPSIKVIKESAFVPKKFLPIIWNSNVPESWIWRIKELSEHFIYMCDDMYIGKPTSRSDFFTPMLAELAPILRLYEGPPDYPAKTNSPIPYVQMWSNAVAKYGLHYTRIQHQALPYRKSHMKKFYSQFKAQVDAASENKIRAGAKDFNLLRFTSSLAVMSGDSVLRVTHDDVDFFTESDDYERIKRIPKVKPQFFCINNNNASNKRVYNMLHKYFA